MYDSLAATSPYCSMSESTFESHNCSIQAWVLEYKQDNLRGTLYYLDIVSREERGPRKEKLLEMEFCQASEEQIITIVEKK